MPQKNRFTDMGNALPFFERSTSESDFINRLSAVFFSFNRSLARILKVTSQNFRVF
jgi:hypothetical protein